MTSVEVAEKYIELLQRGDYDALLDLFSIGAFVDSPIYGLQQAPQFFNILKENTSESILKIHGIYEKKGANELALYFEYIWRLNDGSSAKFDVVDIMKFNEQNKIQYLQIIYDTKQVRPLLSEL